MKTKSDEAVLELLGQTIRDLRTDRGWTQGQLAARADLHENYVWGIEKGLRNVSAINLVRLAAAFDVAPAELWSEFSSTEVRRILRRRR